jgi:murein L,D-transpeptidase YcbB/YkuD
MKGTLSALLPAHAGYKHLRDTLAIYRKFAEAGGWPIVPSGKKLQLSDRSERVILLRQRLAAEGFLTNAGADDSTLFGINLDQALKKFQIQNSLDVDGILGTNTLQALNISADQRVRQMLGDRFIFVNIAGFYLNVIEQETLVLDMRVVAGKTYRKTPVFSDKITYLVISSYWGVSNIIAKKDIRPKVKKDPKRWGDNTREIDSRIIDWNTVTAANLKYRFKQDPGPQNALGRIKFMFPNKFDVYLHDTPAKELFVKARRDFSSGCIRIEKPVELAKYLLRNHPDWPPEKIRSTLTGSDITVKTVKLSEPANIHILYWTVWVGKDGRIYFSPDVYDRDKSLDIAMQSPPPGA